ncbi:acyltransferase family protein [Caenimonas terrae]|uniref:Acyltransferase family protein n=1 Tax=Caenimonas terrae TaxID=696074 RepID=A0ABW0NIZ4_9BURK
MQASQTARDNIDPLTGFRFLAAMLVFVSHYDIPGLSGTALRATRSGYAGVTLFFVLSGFVIGYNYLDRFESRMSAGLVRDYLVARLARVYPLYVCFIVFGYLAQGMTSLPWTHLFALQPWSADSKVAFGVNAAAWSIGVEAFLYLAFPLLVPVLAWLKVLSSLRRLQVAAVVVVAAMLYAAVYFTSAGLADLPLEHPASPHRWLYRVPAFRLGDFLLGILGATFFLRYARTDAQGLRRWSMVTYLAAVLILLLLAARKNFHSAFSWDLAYAVPAMLMILGLAINRGSALSRFLSSPALVLLGESSYAFYLVHLPAAPMHHGTVRGVPYELALYLVFLGLVIALSIGLHIAIETPARRWLRQRLAPARAPADTRRPPEAAEARLH